MKRTEEKSWVTLYWTEELDALREEIADILAYYNPNHPETLGRIMWGVAELVGKINSQWQLERLDVGLEAARDMEKTMGQVILAALDTVKARSQEEEKES